MLLCNYIYIYGMFIITFYSVRHRESVVEALPSNSHSGSVRFDSRLGNQLSRLVFSVVLHIPPGDIRGNASN
jgi:hypothetical protein